MAPMMKAEQAAAALGSLHVLLQDVVVVDSVVLADGFGRLCLIDFPLQTVGALQVCHGFGGRCLLQGFGESLAGVQLVVLVALLLEERGSLCVAQGRFVHAFFAGEDVAHLVLADAPRVEVAAAEQEWDGFFERVSCLIHLREGELCACQLREAHADAGAVAQLSLYVERPLCIEVCFLVIAQRAVYLRRGAVEHGPAREVVGVAVGGDGFRGVLLCLAGLACCHEDAGDVVQRGAHAVVVARFLVEQIALVERVGGFLVLAQAEA